MSTITETLTTIAALQTRLLDENASTTSDIDRAMSDIAAAHANIAESINATFSQVLRDLQAVRDLRTAAIADAIGPEPVQIDGDAPAMLQAAE
jgi:hypothetical protein